MLNHATVCFFVYAHTYRHRAVGVCLNIIACHGHYILSSSHVEDICTRYRSLMHVESSTMLDHIPLELPLHGVDSFSEDTFV